ncbi:MAG TPA: hypothetical protein VF164_01170 [Trueperaceae bacterium]
MDPVITFERVSDAAQLQVFGDAEFTRDQVGNLTVTWSDPLKARAPATRLTRGDFAGFVSEGVEQHRNRAAAYLVITDPGGALLKVTWQEIDPWAGTLLEAQELYGAAMLVNTSASIQRDGISLIVYRADYRFQRGAGLLEQRPSP